MINLDNLKSLSKDNHAFIREILEVYLMNTPKDVESMEAAVESGDFQMVRYFAHKLKSSSFTIGFNDGFKVFQEIEHDIKNEFGEENIPQKLRVPITGNCPLPFEHISHAQACRLLKRERSSMQERHYHICKSTSNTTQRLNK